MTPDLFEDPRKLSLAAGVAGAAAMAMFDIQKPLRALQQLVIGSLVATFGTDAMYPFISKALGFLQVPLEYQPNTAPFIVGATAMFLLEYIRAFAARQTKGGDDK